MKKLIKIGLSIIMLLALVSIAYATCTWSNPAASATLSGKSQINVSCTHTDNATQCNVTASSVASGDTIAKFELLNASTLASTDYSGLNATLDTTGEVDASDWVFSAVCNNVDNTSISVTDRSSITIDNGVPAISATSPADDVKYVTEDERRDVVFSATCSNATSAILYLNGAAHTMTESSDTCTYTKDFLADQIWNWYITASDGKDTTTGSTYQIEVTTPGGGSNNPTSLGYTPPASNANIGGLILVALAAFLLFSGKKKKK